MPELNDRQRAHLLAIFETDQEVEQEMRDLPYRPFQQRPKASEWRWLEYAEPVPILGRPGSPLWKRIKKLGMVDQGTGSTFSALAGRGLVSVQWHRVNVHGQGVPHLHMTTAGRKLARSVTGAKAYKAPPAGTLKEWPLACAGKGVRSWPCWPRGRVRRLRAHWRANLATATRVQVGRAESRNAAPASIKITVRCAACTSLLTVGRWTSGSGLATASSTPTSKHPSRARWR